MEDLALRIQRLEDLEEIRTLKHRYCFLVDRAVAGEAEKAAELAGLFVPQGWADFGAFGKFEGADGLLLFFKDMVPGLLSYTSHMVHNPVIEISGDEATGDWYFEVPSTLKATNMAGWLQGRYEEQYLRTPDGWRWLSMTAKFDYATPFDQGWAKTPMFEL